MTSESDTSGIVHDNASGDLNRSVETATSPAPSSSNFSVSSESDLLIPGKLYADIVRLKNCYQGIISQIDPNSNSDPGSLENPSTVLMLNKEQMAAGMKKRNNKFNVDVAKNSLVELLDCVRPLCLPLYQLDSHPRPSSVTQDSQITLLTARVESLCSQNKSDNEALTTQVESLKSTLSNFENYVTTLSPSQHHAPSPEPIPIHPDHVFLGHITPLLLPHMWTTSSPVMSVMTSPVSSTPSLPSRRKKGDQQLSLGRSTSTMGLVRTPLSSSPH